MLNELRKAMRISTTAYDTELVRLLKAGAADLNVVLRDEITGLNFTISAGAVTDNCTLTDDIIITALFTYVRAFFGSPDDYDRVKASYDEQKAQLLTKSGYGLEGDDSNV